MEACRTVKIFDTHTHVFPDKIAAATLEALSRRSGNLPCFTEGTAGSIAEHARKAGYSGWMNCPVVTRPGQAEKVNLWAAAHNCWPALSLGGLHPLDSSPEDILKRIAELGLHGVKFHPEYQEFRLLDSGMERIWTACEELGLPVLIHAGEDVGFRPPFHSCPADFAELARRHEGLVIVAAHTGGWNCWDDVERHLVGSRVYMDSSLSMPFMKDRSQFLRIARAHGTDRILFGTDSPWQDLDEAVSDMLSCGLGPDELEAVFWGNAGKVWRCVPELGGRND